jgi:predicted glycoside hydrolase/deacetylase ChbG (UPF0249 family)
MTGRYLIVNADDFGQSPGANRGIIQAHREGIVTSTSLMVRWPDAVSAADFGREHPELSLGLHVDLGEWAFRDERWVPLYEVVAADSPGAIADEVARQLERFRKLVGRDPTHIDSHQHVHRSEPARSIVLQLSQELKVPLRHFSPVRYCGDFYGQTGTGVPFPEGLTPDWLIGILAALPRGITELGCHPGIGDDVGSMYCTERAHELQTLCDSQIKATLAAEGIELCSFHDFDRHDPSRGDLIPGRL